MYRLRSAKKEDIELLIKYKLSTIYAYADEIDEEEKNRINEYVNNSVLQLLDKYKVIVLDEKNVGCLLVTEYEDGVMIDEVYLEEKYRNLGIGSSLLRGIISKHDVVYLWVYKKNRGAIQLYHKLGFKVALETETRYFMEVRK